MKNRIILTSAVFALAAFCPAGCAGDRVKVRYRNLAGWLDPDAQCPNPVTLCN